MPILQTVCSIVDETLGLTNTGADLATDTRLLGSIPELDSMSILSILTQFEQNFDITINFDDIDADVFSTIGSLCEFIEKKLSE